MPGGSVTIGVMNPTMDSRTLRKKEHIIENKNRGPDDLCFRLLLSVVLIDSIDFMRFKFSSSRKARKTRAETSRASLTSVCLDKLRCLKIRNWSADKKSSSEREHETKTIIHLRCSISIENE